ncbi:MAG TPA: iron ABC transporter permease [Candidatus Dormibacteraeota bacterium]|jgi:iron complex transport system permease protein|nr:iron ABC transporter permease [Candidatus Dormibacteraeota bacterium]
MQPLTLGKVAVRCGILAVILFVVVVIALKFGAVPVSLYGLAKDLLGVLIGRSSEISSEYGMIIREIRLPRIALGIFVGASLSVAGTSFQALLRNPLADPYVLGVSSGAAVGSIVALIIEPHLALRPEIAAVFTPLGGFLGATVTIAVVYFLGRRQGQMDSNTLLLSGVITGSFLSAVIILLITMLPSSSVRSMAYWLMGDLSTPMAPILGWVLRVGFFAGFALIYLTASDLNLLLAGEKEAMHLGVDVRKVQILVYLAASALTGLAVAVGGAIGYVGLLIPHVMRLIFGTDYRMLLPATAFGGAIAAVIADTVARTVAAPNELPVGAITAMAGAPLFIYLLRRRLA